MPRFAQHEKPQSTEFVPGIAHNKHLDASREYRKMSKVESKHIPPPQEALPSAEDKERQRETIYTTAHIAGMRVRANLAKARHIEGTWNAPQDTHALTELRDSELQLESLLSTLGDQDLDESDAATKNLRERAAVTAKEIKDIIVAFSKDAKAAADKAEEDEWDAPLETTGDVVAPSDAVIAIKREAVQPGEIVVGEEDFMNDEMATAVKTDAVQPGEIVVGDEDFVPTEEEMAAKKEFHTASDAELEQAVDTAFANIAPVEPVSDLEIDRAFRGTEKSLLAIPADIASTRSLYVDLNRKAAAISPETISKLGDNAVYSYLIDLSKSHAELEERRANLEHIKNPTEDDAEEKALIADALHLIEDMRHDIHKATNPFEAKQAKEQTFKSLVARKRGIKLPRYPELKQRMAEREELQRKEEERKRLIAKQEAPLSPFEQQMELKAKLKEELEACERDLKVLVEKAKPGTMAELFLPQYASRGVMGFLARSFQPKPKIDQKAFQAIIGRMKNAQRAFNDRYYTASEKAENIIGGYAPKDGRDIENEMANLRTKRKGKKSMGGFMPIDSMEKDDDLVDVWRSLTKEITALDEDLSTPIDMTDKHTGQTKVETRQHAETEEQRIKTLRKKEEEVAQISKQGADRARAILKTISENPYSKELAGRATEYLADLSQLTLATASRDESLIQKHLDIFEDIQSTMLEKGITIEDGQNAILSAKAALEDLHALPPKKLKDRAVRAITSSRKWKGKKPAEAPAAGKKKKAA